MTCCRAGYSERTRGAGLTRSRSRPSPTTRQVNISPIPVRVCTTLRTCVVTNTPSTRTLCTGRRASVSQHTRRYPQTPLSSLLPVPFRTPRHSPINSTARTVALPFTRIDRDRTYETKNARMEKRIVLLTLFSSCSINLGVSEESSDQPILCIYRLSLF